jgi:pimeloyl-ACP methyl ester carboxylesterase
MNIYAFSGLGADERVFQNLHIRDKIIPVPWIQPQSKESIKSYADRISKNINTEQPFGILGVSFGGLIAVEVSKLTRPNHTILISSAETTTELRPLYSWVGKTRILNTLPAAFFIPPPWLASRLFGAVNKQLLKEILHDTDPHFAKWACHALCTWTNKTPIPNCIKISGDKDLLIPPGKNAILVRGGGHFMVVDRAGEVSEIIRNSLS